MLAIVALVSTLLLPVLGDVGALRVEAAARRLAETVRLARDGAILGGTPAVVVIDLDRGRWRVGPEERGALPPGVLFRAVRSAGEPPVHAGVARLDLNPAGDPLEARVDLADGRGRTASVVIPRGAGRVTVPR